MNKWENVELSDDELLENLVALQQVAISRNRIGFKIYDGQYTVGTDIPQGSYRLEFDCANENSGLDLYIFPKNDPSADTTKSKRKKEPEYREHFDLCNGKRVIGKFQVFNGETLKLETWIADHAVLTKFTGLEIYVKPSTTDSTNTNQELD